MGRIINEDDSEFEEVAKKKDKKGTGKHSRGLKEGRLTREEWDIIREYADKETDRQIAKRLGRSIEAVKRFREKHLNKLGRSGHIGETEDLELKQRLKSKYYWDDIKKQFSASELEFFSEMWVKIIKQFSGDIIETEENQVVDYIRLEILKNRNLIDRQKAVKKMTQADTALQKLLKDNGPPPYTDPQIHEQFADLSETASNYSGSLSSRMEEYKKLLEKQADLRKAMKGSRDDRIKMIENSRKSLHDWINMLLDYDYRNKEGRMISMVDKATDKEYEKLGSLHIYDDNFADQPILNSETVEWVEDITPKRNEDEGNQ